eukprot:gene20109-31446_t
MSGSTDDEESDDSIDQRWQSMGHEALKSQGAYYTWHDGSVLFYPLAPGGQRIKTTFASLASIPEHADGNRDLSEAATHLAAGEVEENRETPELTVIGRPGSKSGEGYATEQDADTSLFEQRPAEKNNWRYNIRQLNQKHPLYGKGYGHECLTLLQLSARSGTAAGGTVKFTNANAKAHTQLCHPGAAAQLGWGKEQAGQRKLITAIEETIAADVSSSGGGGAAAKSLAKKLLPFSPKRQHPGTVAEQRAAQMQYYIFTGQPKSMFQNGYFTSMMETCNPAAALVKYTDVPALTHAMFAVFVFLIQLVVTESVKFFGGAQCMMAGHDAVTIQGFDKIFKYAIGLLVKAADEGQYQEEDEFRKNLRSFAKFLKRPSCTPLIVAMFAAWAAESNEFGPFKCETNTDGFVDMMTQDDFEELVQLHAIGLLSQIFITVVQYQKYWTGAFAHILRMLALKAHEDVVTGGVPLMVIELDAIANQSVRNLDSIKEEIDFDDLQALSKKVLEKALEEAKDRCNQEMSPAEMAAAAFDPRVLNLEHIVGEDAAGIKTKIAAAAEDAYVRFSMKQPASMAAAEAGAAARIAQDADAAVDSIPAMPALKRRRSGPSVTIITPPAAPAESSNQLGAAQNK